jgi:MFS family permease
MVCSGLRGGALGWLTAAAGFGALAAGVIGGYLWQAYGPEMAFGAGSCFIVAGLFIFYAAYRSEEVLT